jgi:hypothetical protein
LLLLNLYDTWSFDPTLKLAVSRNNNDYPPANRYNELRITKRTINVVDDLEAAGLIHSSLGYPAHEKKPGRVSRIWPTNVLVEHFKAAQFTPFDIGHHTDRETIIVSTPEQNQATAPV